VKPTTHLQPTVEANNAWSYTSTPLIHPHGVGDQLKQRDKRFSLPARNFYDHLEANVLKYLNSVSHVFKGAAVPLSV
jgi:hypothetical protein